MHSPDHDPQDAEDDDRVPQPQSTAARAEAAILAIAAGADPGAEALNVSNRFTDDLTARMRNMFGRRRRRDGGTADPD